jgi:hypothetical protein
MIEVLAGRLVRDEGGFVLLADDGRRVTLLLARTPVDQVEKRVWIAGRFVAGDLFEADGVSLVPPDMERVGET